MSKLLDYPYLYILDFEATCWDGSKDHEIIEFPTVIVSTKERKIVARHEQFVKPLVDPTVSPFCHKLTTITQAQVDSGISFPEALKANTKFVSRFPGGIFVTCGDWDLKTMLPADAWNHYLDIPSQYRRWINVKTAFKSVFTRGKDKMGMEGMLSTCGLKLLGTHHRGIDDCVNIARIAINLMDRVAPVAAAAVTPVSAVPTVTALQAALAQKTKMTMEQPPKLAQPLAAAVAGRSFTMTLASKK